MSPTIRRAALSGTAFIRACISRTSTMDVSSTTSRSQSSGLSSPRLKPPPLGSTSSNRWMVLGLEAGRLGHALRSAAGWRTEQKAGAFRREDMQDRLYDCGLSDARSAVWHFSAFFWSINTNNVVYDAKMRVGSWPWLCPQRHPADQWAQLRVDLRRSRNAKTGKIPIPVVPFVCARPLPDSLITVTRRHTCSPPITTENGSSR